MRQQRELLNMQDQLKSQYSAVPDVDVSYNSLTVDNSPGLANGGILTPATEFTGEYTPHKYYFESKIYDHRVYNGVGNPQKDVDIQFGPNIKDWP